MANARRHGAAAERNQHGVDRPRVFDELEADRPGAFAGVEVFAVFDQKRAFVCRHPPRQKASLLDVALDDPHRRAERANALQLQRARPGASHDRHRNSAALSAPGQRLPKVADAGANGRP